MSLQLVTSDTAPSESYLRGFSDARARLGRRGRWLMKATIVAALLAIAAVVYAVVDHEPSGARPPVQDRVVTRVVTRTTAPPVKHRPTKPPTRSQRQAIGLTPRPAAAPRPVGTVTVREVPAATPHRSAASSPAGPSTVVVAPAPSPTPSSSASASNCLLPSLLHSCVPVG